MSGKGSYLLFKDSEKERKKLEKQASKKGLYGSIGRTLGGLLGGALTGGLASPFLAGAISAGMSAIGGAVGSNQQKISGGKFHGDARSSLSKDLSGTGTENLTQSLLTGITTGGALAAQQKVGLMKGNIKKDDIGGLNFKGSFVGELPGSKAGSIWDNYIGKRGAGNYLSTTGKEVGLQGKNLIDNYLANLQKKIINTNAQDIIQDFSSTTNTKGYK
jgi:hypothetical protein